MRTEPDPAHLFPEVVAEGSLAAALRKAAHGKGYVLDIVGPDQDPLRHASVPSPATGREPLGVSAWRFEPRWSISGFGRGAGSGEPKWLISGSTQDLTEIAIAAHGWQNGLSLSEIARIAPFVELTGYLEVPDDDPVHAIASQWSYLRADALRAAWPEQHELIEAAYARPEMRSRHAYTSHWSLRFPTSGDQTSSPDLVCLEASPGGKYTVRARWNGPIIGQTAMAEEAVSVAINHLPAMS